MQQSDGLLLSSALRDFREARRKAAFEDLKSRLTGRSDDLLSYAEVNRALGLGTSAERTLADIPLDAIVGSVGRYSDFTRSFLPRRSSDAERWAKVKLKMQYHGGLPPIEVYRVGGVYFVLDGNHRVSVARELGATHIQAYVTEVGARIPLTPDVKPDQLIIMARQARFLERTQLDRSRPEADLTVTAPGQYRALEDQIAVHQAVLERQLGREVNWPEAASHWYDHVYMPVTQIIRELDLLRDFPGRTETDLYVWVSRRQEELEDELGWPVRPEAVAVNLAEEEGRSLGRVVARLGERLLDVVVPPALERGPAPGTWRRGRASERAGQRLFSEVLVPVSGSSRGWFALEQALVVAQREGSRLHGFHVVRVQGDLHREQAERVRAEFAERCRRAGVSGELSVEVGPVTRSICERARWTDLVVANLQFPPAHDPVRKLASGFRQLLRRCSRPVLAVPRVTALNRALLAFDNSPQAREALFVAAYLAERWLIELVVLTVVEPSRTSEDTLLEARTYLQRCRLVPHYVLVDDQSVPDAIVSTASAYGCDFVVMGGYGFSPVLEVVLGSALDHLLRESRQPLLVCR